MKSSTQNLVLTALLAAVICILSPLSVPIGPVPISLATFAVMLAGCLLGAKWGTLATLIYILLGAVGVPVFAGYSGGFQDIAGMTGGYIVGYLPLAFCSGLIYDRLGRSASGVRRIAFMIIGMVVGTAVLYALGTAWFCVVSGMNVVSALALCVTPFLIGDTMKIIVVAVIVPQLERALNAGGAFAQRRSAS